MSFNMPCLNPTIIKSPESRLLDKCRAEHRSFEYYQAQARQRRNVLYDPVPLVDNPHDYYFSFIPYRQMSVPCGKCDLCLKQRVDDYFIRCYYEYLYTTLALKGSCWFITLTYADDILPKVHPTLVDKDTGEILGVDPVEWPCFSKRHIQLFLKRFRKYSDLELKYFIVSEFGGEFGRPHYHGILFIRDFEPTEANKFRLTNVIANCWTKLEDRNFKFQSMREYSLFDVQRIDVKLLNSTKMIRYVCKYVGKQFGAIEFDKLIIPEDNKRFHLQSIGLGEKVYDYCNADIWDKGYLTCDGYKYAIPLYYKTKLFREYYCEHENGSIIYRPTDFKYQYIAALSVRMIEEHKNLSILNFGYPRLPDIFYNPNALADFEDYIFRYHQLNETDVAPSPRCEDMFSLLLDYLQEVQKYNLKFFKAKASKWKEQQLQYYQKKTGRK